MTYLQLAEHYESCFEQHGDSHKGVDWPNADDAVKRHLVMLGIIRPSKEPVTLLDFGCGTAHLLETINALGRNSIEYSGADISSKFVEHCRSKFPHSNFYALDILQEPLPTDFDYIVCNGVFTEKLKLSHDEMFSFLDQSLCALWQHARKGIAFNVMSKHVDWEREDLFHVPFDDLMRLCKQKLSRHIRIRADYGLYEYTAYVYKEPCDR